MPDDGFHPDLRLTRLLPRGVVSARSLWRIRKLGALSTRLHRSRAVEEPVQPGVSVFVHGRTASAERKPALLWIHGGGLVIGNARLDEGFCSRVAEELGAVVASVEYRLAPDHPFPVPLEDCYAALRWLAQQPHVDAERIAIGGASAGGGLAAALALLARERGEVHPAFQLLVYPMLDDRTTLRTDVDENRLRMWNQDSNRLGWQSYLGPYRRPGQPDGVPELAAPARAEDLSGLPPAWIGVGTHDLFHDEDVDYAQRLRDAGVECEVHVVPGAYHGFDAIEQRAAVSQEFTRRQVEALARALGKAGAAGS
ncbi:alpha/beta hydrolase [Kineococcus xinjiangensis]|uniref:alpha/beta hydrolase n=1 Tax=Kineococcus xinjiangensis TaxID=512762 RepID=UPI000CEBBE39